MECYGMKALPALLSLLTSEGKTHGNVAGMNDSVRVMHFFDTVGELLLGLNN
jgi:hypothetical protein